MYIACPSCSTSFSVDGAMIGTDGRAVRCFNCNHSWHQYPVVHQPQPQYVPVQYVPPGQFAVPPQMMAQPAAPAPVPEPVPVAEPAPLPEPEPEPIPEPEPLPEPEPIPEEDLPSDDELEAMLGAADDVAAISNEPEIEEPEEISLEDLEELEDPEPFESHHPPETDDFDDEEEIDPDDIPDPDPISGGLYDPDEDDLEEESKGGIVKMLIKVLVILIVVGGLGGGAIFMRGIVVDLVPASHIVFELLGMRVAIPGDGLKLQSGNPKREQRDGKEVIVVRGSITNISDIEQQVPEILIRAIDAEEQVVQIQTLKLAKTRLAPGKSEKFESVFKNLVPTARRLDVTYGAFIMEDGSQETAPEKDAPKK